MESNDPLRPRAELSIGGEVMRFATIDPKRIVLQGYGGETLQHSALIVPEPRFPFRIIAVRSANGDRFVDQRIEMVHHNNRPAYRLVVVNRRKEPGRYYETITLATDNPVRPELQVHVYGHILAAPDRAEAQGKTVSVDRSARH